MSSETQRQETIADRLRTQDFVKLPPLWVRRDEIPEIFEITNRSKEAVNAVRRQYDEDFPPAPVPLPKPKNAKMPSKKHPNFVVEKKKKFSVVVPKADPRLDKNAAWDAYDRAR